MNRRLAVALTVLLVAAIGLIAALVVRADGGPDGGNTPSPTSTSASTNPVDIVPSNLLVLMGNDDNSAIAATLEGVSSNAKGASRLSIPADLSLDLDEDGQNVALNDFEPETLQSAVGGVSDQLGVEVTGGLWLERLTLTALVDQVDGVEVGSQGRVLEGAAAAKYVQGNGSKESKERTAQRFDVVWSQIVEELPHSLEQLRGIVTSLGSKAKSTLSVDDLARQLAMLTKASDNAPVDGGAVVARVTGTGPSAGLTLVPAPTFEVVDSLFVDTVLKEGVEGFEPRVRFELTGASAQSVGEAMVKTRASGFVAVWGGTRRDRSTDTVMLVANDSGTKATTTKLDQTLGLSSSSTVVSKSGVVGADVVVRTGSSFSS